jgi:dihydropteroate synthase
LAGINDVIIDPGFGFSKTIAHNFELLRNMSALKCCKSQYWQGFQEKALFTKH